jgi:hypothetical protein
MTRNRRVVVLLIATIALAAAGAGTSSATSARQGRDLPDPAPCDGCWHPTMRTSWQWQLQGKIDLSVHAHMFDTDMFETPAATVQTLHDKGRMAVCYVDAGTWENFRPDASKFPDEVKGKSNGWPGERWLDIRRLDVLGPILQARIKRCAAKGFDGIEFDNVDGYANHTGFPLTGADQLRFDVWLANHAHHVGLAAALKNDLGQVGKLLPYFDFALDEQCFQYHECGREQPFLDAGKAVFEVEYKLDPPAFCPKANDLNFNSMKKKLSLKVWRHPCR